MNDQAKTLRESILGQAALRPSPGRTVTVLAGKGGVGTTTIAVNLATAAAQLGRRVCLFDADTVRCDVAFMLGMDDRDTDRICSLENWHARLPCSAEGVFVACAGQFMDQTQRQHAVASGQLASRLHKFAHPFDLVIVDVGYQSHQVQTAWTALAQSTLVVSTTETVAVLDAYALLKRLHSLALLPNVGLILNQVAQEEQALACTQRLCESSRRFLGHSPDLWNHVPLDHRFRESRSCRSPLVAAAPNAPAARSIVQTAEQLSFAVRAGKVRTISHFASPESTIG